MGGGGWQDLKKKAGCAQNRTLCKFKLHKFKNYVLFCCIHK